MPYAWEICLCPVAIDLRVVVVVRDMWQIRNAELDIVDQGGCVEFRSNR